MKKKRIVVTGVGILASNGIGKENFWHALKEGKSGFKSVSLFDTSDLKVKIAGEIADFNAEEFLGKKGIYPLEIAPKDLVLFGGGPFPIFCDTELVEYSRRFGVNNKEKEELERLQRKSFSNWYLDYLEEKELESVVDKILSS